MTTKKFSNALVNISESYVNEAATYIAKKKVNPRLKWEVSAACLILLTVTLLTISPFSNAPGSSLINTTTPGDSNAIPQYVPAFSSPDLETLYKEQPYCQLLPLKMPQDLAFQSSYKTEYDQITNPNGEHYLKLCFGPAENPYSLELSVRKYDGNTTVADPQNTDTYDLSLYYEYLKTPGNVAADAPGSISLFRAEDFSEEIMKKRMYVFDYGHCKVEIGILCGEYVVEYCYVGEEISPQAFYEIIISSRHFDTMGQK